MRWACWQRSPRNWRRRASASMSSRRITTIICSCRWSGLRTRCESSEQYIEIRGESPSPVPEEVPERGVVDIVVDRLRIEMVGQVEHRERQPDGVLRIELD